MTIRIAMWSGPRNISTAMMRAFEARGDCAVSDEPLYAHYLKHTELDHPMKNEVMASQPTDWQPVIKSLVNDSPGEKPFWYQKHMTHHLLPHIDREWMKEVRHCFLIRDPKEVLSSYTKSRTEVTVDDLGFEAQAEILSLGNSKGRRVCSIEGLASQLSKKLMAVFYWPQKGILIQYLI